MTINESLNIDNNDELKIDEQLNLTTLVPSLATKMEEKKYKRMQ
jgi:hypothetical protein